MTEAQYKAVTAEDMKAKKWRLVHPIASSVVQLASGTRVLLQLKRKGFNIRAGCDTCGMRAFIRKVPYAFIEECK